MSTIIKVLDCTVLSARTLSVPSVDFLNRCCPMYNLVVTDDVEMEMNKCRTTLLRAEVETVQCSNPRYQKMFEYLKARHPNLGLGELSSFLYAFLEGAATGKPYYFVTDDALMRKKINAILQDPQFIAIAGVKVQSFNHTGTIGLIIRLVEKGLITKAEALKIHADLSKDPYFGRPILLEKLWKTAQAR